MPSRETKAALLAAAAELIADVGWGRVTTRAIAQRAGLPHGTVSYHFRGKDDLLRQAAVWALDSVFADESWTQATRSTELVDLVEAVGTTVPAAGDEAAHRQLILLSECLVQGARDPELREVFRAYLGDYRQVLAERAARDAATGRLRNDLDPAQVATLVVAAVDGLMVHAALDPRLDAAGAGRALASLLRPPRTTPRDEKTVR